MAGRPDIDTKGGNYNESIGGDYVEGNKTTNHYNTAFFSFLKPQRKTLRKNTTREKLIKQVATEISSRLANSLHNHIYIVVDKQANPGQV